MSVTTINCLSGRTINKRNNQRCERCGQLICETETIYKRKVYIRKDEEFYPEWKHWEQYITRFNRHLILSICENCVGNHFNSKYHRLHVIRNCDNCSRPVVSERFRRYTQHVFCCARCESGYYSRKQSESRAEKRRDMTCDVCGDLFTPKRIDALTCSNKCRQRLYRI